MACYQKFRYVSRGGNNKEIEGEFVKRYNALQLKLFMSILMVFDHLNHVPRLISADLAGVFHILTRCVSVFFAYMAIEGFVYTRNRLKYNGRLFLWAGIMSLGNNLFTDLYTSKGIYVSNNIFLTLAMGILALNIWYFVTNGNKLNAKLLLGIKIIIGIVVTGVGMFFTEGGIVVIPFMLICYGFRNKIKVRNLVLSIFSILLFLMSYQDMGIWQDTVRMLMFNSDWFFISVIPFLYLYNGERGRKSVLSKYFFYTFYPAHLWIIATIAFFVS